MNVKRVESLQPGRISGENETKRVEKMVEEKEQTKKKDRRKSRRYGRWREVPGKPPSGPSHRQSTNKRRKERGEESQSKINRSDKDLGLLLLRKERTFRPPQKGQRGSNNHQWLERDFVSQELSTHLALSGKYYVVSEPVTRGTYFKTRTEEGNNEY